MKTKSLLTALALPAIFAACTNEEFVEAIEGQQPVQEIVGANLVSNGLSINVTNGIESRMTQDGVWTLTDKLGLGWLNVNAGGIDKVQEETSTHKDHVLYANHMFQLEAEGGDFTTYGNVYEGYHFAYFPYVRMNQVGTKKIDYKVNNKQTESWETDRNNRALYLSPQIFLTSKDVQDDKLVTEKSFEMNKITNQLVLKTNIGSDIREQEALTSLAVTEVEVKMNANGVASVAPFVKDAELLPRNLPVATYDAKKEVMVCVGDGETLKAMQNVSLLMGSSDQDESKAIRPLSASSTLNTLVEGEFASLSNELIGVNMFTFPTFKVSAAKENPVTITIETGAGYFTVEYKKDAVEGTDAYVNNKAIEKLVKDLTDTQKADMSNSTLYGKLGVNFNYTLNINKSMFVPDYSNIKSETDWNTCVAIANALDEDDVKFNVAESFAFTGEIQTPDAKNFYVTTATDKAITVGTAEGITWPEEIKVPAQSNLAVIVAEDAVLNVEGTEEAPATMNATSIANKGIINVNAWGAVSDNTTSALDNTEGRVVVEYGAYVYPDDDKEGVIAYVVENAEKEDIAKINVLIKENSLLGYANVNTLVVKTDLDLNALAADEIADNRYEAGSLATRLSSLNNIDIELNGGSLSKAIIGGANNTVQNVTATAGVNVLNYGVKVVNNITVAEDATLTIENAADTKDYKANVIKNDLHVDGTLFVNVVMNVKNVINHNSGNITVAPRFGIYYTSNYVQEGTASGRIEKLIASGTANVNGVVNNNVITFSITNAKQLQKLAESHIDNLASSNGKVVIKLINDIDMQNVPFKGINAYISSKNIEFDGNGYTIKNLLLEKTNNFMTMGETPVAIGLFKSTPNNGTTTIKNLTIDGVSFKDNDVVWGGALIGYKEGNVEVENVTVKNATLIGASEIGGLIGFSTTASTTTIIKNSKVEDSIIKATQDELGGSASGAPAGGLIGFAVSAIELKDCESKGNTIEAALGFYGDFIGSIYNASKVKVDDVDVTPTSFPNINGTESWSIGF